MSGGANWAGRRSDWIIFLLGLIVKGGLVWRFPALYGGDTVLHLRNYNHLLLGHQLPMLQALIYLSHAISRNPLLFRLVLIVVGAVSGVGFYRLCLILSDQRAAFWAAVFFVSNPFLNEVSIVPFQEMLMLGTLCFAFYFYLVERPGLAAIFLGVACLTRYEAWIAWPLLLYDYVVERGFSLKTFLNAFAMFGCVPLIWIAWHLNLSAPGTYVIELPTSASRLMRWVYLGWICVKNTPIPVLALAGAGAMAVVRWRRFEKRAIALSAGFVILFLIGVLLSAHGDPHPDNPNAELFVTSREATILVGSLLVLSAFGVQLLLQSQRWNMAGVWICVAACMLGLFQSARFVASETSRPEVQLSYATAKFLESHVSRGQKVLILANNFSEKDWDLYLEKSRQLSGEAGYRAARARLAEADLSPIDFQRTAVQTDLPSDKLLWNGGPADATWVVVWSNCAQAGDISQRLAAFQDVKHFEAGHLGVSIWRRSASGARYSTTAAMTVRTAQASKASW